MMEPIPSRPVTEKERALFHAARGVGTWDKTGLAASAANSALSDLDWGSVDVIDSLESGEIHGRAGDFAAVSVLADRILNSPRVDAPRLSNTGGMISQETSGESLHPPEFYLPHSPPPRAEYVTDGPEHWSIADPSRFESVPQGGGGIDWLTVSVYGYLTPDGVGLVEALCHAKNHLGKKSEEFKTKCAEVGLEVLSHKYRDHALIAHPYDAKKFLKLGSCSSGNGRSFQPLIVQIDGITVRFGRIKESEGGDKENLGPVAFVEIPGLEWLRHGMAGAQALAERVVRSLGLRIRTLRASRMDACVDLIDIDVQTFVDTAIAGGMVTRAKKGFQIFHGPVTAGERPKIEAFCLSSGAVQLKVYDKLAELRVSDKTGEKTALMIQNRWGCSPRSAVRVEFKFTLGKNRAKKYENWRELFESLGDLVSWACNVWVRFCHVTDKTHTTRAAYCDHWVRTIHAFAWWASKLDKRPEDRPKPQGAPVRALLMQMAGCLASACGRAGIVPVDDYAVFEFIAQYMGPGAITALCRERAIEAQAARGVSVRELFVAELEE